MFSVESDILSLSEILARESPLKRDSRGTIVCNRRVRLVLQVGLDAECVTGGSAENPAFVHSSSVRAPHARLPAVATTVTSTTGAQRPCLAVAIVLCNP